jgi:uncharacterized membrane protein (DUF485 family)
MSSILVAAVVFVCTFGGALFGIVLRSRLPAHHLDDSTDTVKLIMGLIATLTALVLGLLISSAHSNYDAQSAEIQRLGVHLTEVDLILARFGEDATQPRARLRKLIADDIDRTWRSSRGSPSSSGPFQARLEGDQIFVQVASLSPTTSLQRFGQARALELLANAGETRRLLTEQAQGSVSLVFLLVLTAWLTLLFFGFGLFARFNPTVIVALIAGALSVAAANFLFLEMSHPYSGWMQVSNAPLRDALAEMNK